MKYELMNTLLAMYVIYTAHTSNSRVRHLESRREKQRSGCKTSDIFIWFVIYLFHTMYWSRHYFLDDFWILRIELSFLSISSIQSMLWLSSSWNSFCTSLNMCVILSSILISIHFEMYDSMNSIAMKCDRI